jgi:hypothetical protein
MLLKRLNSDFAGYTESIPLFGAIRSSEKDQLQVLRKVLKWTQFTRRSNQKIGTPVIQPKYGTQDVRYGLYGF